MSVAKRLIKNKYQFLLLIIFFFKEQIKRTLSYKMKYKNEEAFCFRGVKIMIKNSKPDIVGSNVSF